MLQPGFPSLEETADFHHTGSIDLKMRRLRCHMISNAPSFRESNDLGPESNRNTISKCSIASDVQSRESPERACWCGLERLACSTLAAASTCQNCWLGSAALLGIDGTLPEVFRKIAVQLILPLKISKYYTKAVTLWDKNRLTLSQQTFISKKRGHA
ncbi:hypothetical protein THAOC_11534 [Thalassiosira oceanica]|uniref:Uncharacterized protein n=1 Tax=Thalassiosira oceanica TaxID=159749 RepID=K0TA73_THAOC|nr:hypothetical protein THAOC_11534 [Thalassiosira oceanica]|eukprot:EJK67432.1 hypothetical protein THAOC_11534 [Thalassiosira oceanica]